ncbi:hypothetical protein ACS0TY_002607 [Phlomoides rotata]
METMESRVGTELWPDKDFDWAWKEADGRAGGLISIWNRKLFSKTSSWHCRGLLVVNGRWREDGGEMVIINVYAPCSTVEKEQLWETIKLVLEQNEEARICVVEEERLGRREDIDRRDINLFDDLISSSGLVDLPLWGRKFTWYKPDGTCKSKLDRILVNEEWLTWKPDLKLMSLGRSISDHCPIFLRTSIVDWGLKPFKFFNGWLAHADFKDFCIRKWNSYKVQGWKCFTLKEKLKMLKLDLKAWSREIFGALQQKVEDQKENIERLDRFDEIFGTSGTLFI